MSTQICSFIPEVFSRITAPLPGGIRIADAFGIHNKHSRLMGAAMLFPLCRKQFLQNFINQADAVLIRFGPYIAVATHGSPVRKIMRNPSPCTAFLQQIQQCTKYIV